MAKPTQLPVPDRLSTEPTVKPLLATAKSAYQAYEAFLLSHYDTLFPQEAIRRLQQEILTAPLPTVPDLQSKLLTLDGPAAVAARQRLREEVIRAHSPAHEATVAVLRECESLVKSYKADAVQAERNLASDFGVEHRPTSASSKFDTWIQEIGALLTAHTKPEPEASGGNQLPPVTDYFLQRLGVDFETVD